jgi:competence protein ComGC
VSGWLTYIGRHQATVNSHKTLVLIIASLLLLICIANLLKKTFDFSM